MKNLKMKKKNKKFFTDRDVIKLKTKLLPRKLAFTGSLYKMYANSMLHAL